MSIGGSTYLIHFPTLPPEHRWNETWCSELATALTDYKDRFYNDRDALRAGGHTTPLELVEEDTYRPENAGSDGQKIIVYHHLYHQKKLAHYLDQTAPDIDDYPHMQMMLCNGKPGTGKSWILKC